MSDAPKSLAQLCHLQDCSCFSSLPHERGGHFRPAVRCLARYLVQPATISTPGDEDTSQLLTVQSSDQSRVLNSRKPNFSASALLLLEGMCCGELLETLIRLLQKLLFLKIDPVFVALILHSYRCTSPGGRRGCRNPWCFTTLLW